MESIVNRTVPRDFGRRKTAPTFPDGIGAAWRRLEAVYPPRKGRRFYGLTRFDAGQLPYFAAVVPPTEQAAAPAGFVRLIMQGGLYARVKLEGWPERTAPGKMRLRLMGIRIE